MTLKQHIKNHLNQISLRTQLIVLATTIIFVIILAITSFNYVSNKNTIMEQAVKSASAILDFEVDNFDSYMNDINWYSLTLRNDETFLQLISNSRTLSYEDSSYIQSLLKSNYYSRNDVISYKLYLLKKNTLISISSKQIRITSVPFSDFKSIADYDNFTKGKYYLSVHPCESEGDFMEYYRTIIDISTQEPLAIVQLTINDTLPSSLAKNHLTEDEIFAIIDDRNRLYYSSDPELFSEQDLNVCAAELENASENFFRLSLQEHDYLTVYKTSEKNHFKLLVLRPVSSLQERVTVTRNISFLLGLAALIIAVLMFTIFLRLIIHPISALILRMKSAGSGDFASVEPIGGNLEICNLEEEYNTMLLHIDELIKTNYISKLNEETAKLIALEAQTNPHFLYNTLQAISSEAIQNHQTKINDMITSLASLLRYGIKDKDMMSVREEMTQVQNYLMLQKARFDEALSYQIDMDEAVNDIVIPKLSITTLVENSIMHGMTGTVNSIHIHVSAYLENDILWIKVMDNGHGIERERYTEIIESFKDIPLRSEHNTGIGLSNLFNRLKLVYQEKADMEIQSEIYVGTTITLSIPITEDISYVSSTYH